MPPARTWSSLVLVALAACRRPPPPKLEAPPVADVREAGASPAPSASASAAPPPSASPAPLVPPSSQPVRPKLRLVHQGEEEDAGAPPPSPKFASGVRAEGLPAITRDGRYVVVLHEDDSAAACGGSQLLVLERPRPGALGKLISRTRFETTGCVPDEEIGPTGTPRRSPAYARLVSVLASANAKLAGMPLRSLDGGPSQTDRGPEAPLESAGPVAVRLAIARDGDGFPTRLRGAGATGALFDVDLAPIAELDDPAFEDKEKRGRLTAGSTYDVDLAARVLVVRASYMSVNSWFTADRTAHLLAW